MSVGVLVEISYRGQFDSDQLGFDEPIDSWQDATEAVESFGIANLIDMGLVRGDVEVWIHRDA